MDDPLVHQRQLSEEARDAHLRWLITALDVDLVLDVGANRGQFGRGLREGGYAGRLVSLEPAAAPRARLEELAATDPAWEVRPWALGDVEGEAVLHAVDEETELGSLRESSEFGRSWKDVMSRTREERVAVRRLDAAWDELAGDATRVLLKLDTQGFDLAAFRGAGRLVRAGGPVVAVLSEVACLPIYDGVPLMAEHLQEYAAAGWSLAGLYPVSFERASLRVIEHDAVLVRTPEP
ncbi:FkbM family methyltransferase [Nocardioides aurantiacus]|uniref:FkbM family methyltransferase n=1 Tax=Nocardioides aurantiacus TaxID=86796 RepID=A0A3N2CYV1_9ACTN|nr:FkbM family methyltransferase [Nocardioides aurantiacus]ROR92618.1 FkbM family methyltransferase [Nocardioides aurantiacus]